MNHHKSSRAGGPGRWALDTASVQACTGRIVKVSRGACSAEMTPCGKWHVAYGVLGFEMCLLLLCPYTWTPVQVCAGRGHVLMCIYTCSGIP